jgi:radical SAM protein with 4Fe4S-binding SPASM domain
VIRDRVNRTDLAKAIPIRTPFVIHVDTCNVCNFRCRFCTTGDHELLRKYNRPKGFMSYELFCKIIDDMGSFDDKVKDLIFHKNGEPLLHERIVDMLRYAKNKNIANRMILVTNGSLLTPELSREIMSVGPHYIQISLEGVSDKGYEEISRVKVDYNKIVGNVAYLFAHKHPDTILNVKIMDCGLSEQEKVKFHEDFNGICSSHSIEHPISYTQPQIKDTSLGIRTGTTHDMYDSTYKEVCTLPFYTMNINFNGKVSACSFDWRHGHIMGNVGDEGLRDIWMGTTYSQFRLMQLQKKRNEHPLCSGCEAVFNLLDNIDGSAKDILERLTHDG